MIERPDVGREGDDIMALMDWWRSGFRVQPGTDFDEEEKKRAEALRAQQESAQVWMGEHVLPPIPGGFGQGIAGVRAAQDRVAVKPWLNPDGTMASDPNRTLSMKNKSLGKGAYMGQPSDVGVMPPKPSDSLTILGFPIRGTRSQSSPSPMPSPVIPSATPAIAPVGGVPSIRVVETPKGESGPTDNRSAWEKVGGAGGVLDATGKVASGLWDSFTTGTPMNRDPNHYYPGLSTKQPAATAAGGAQGDSVTRNPATAGGVTGATSQPDAATGPWAEGAQVSSFTPGTAMTRSASVAEIDPATAIRAQVDSDPELSGLSEEEKQAIVDQRVYEFGVDMASRGDVLSGGTITRQSRATPKIGGPSVASPELNALAQRHYSGPIKGEQVQRGAEIQTRNPEGYARAGASRVLNPPMTEAQQATRKQEITDARAARDARAKAAVERWQQGGYASPMGLKSKELEKFNPIKQADPNSEPVLDEDAAAAHALQTATQAAGGWSLMDQARYSYGPNTAAGRAAYAKREKIEKGIQRSTAQIRADYESKMESFHKTQDREASKYLGTMKAAKDFREDIEKDGPISRAAKDQFNNWSSGFKQVPIKLGSEMVTPQDYLASGIMSPEEVEKFESAVNARFVGQFYKWDENAEKVVEDVGLFARKLILDHFDEYKKAREQAKKSQAKK